MPFYTFSYPVIKRTYRKITIEADNEDDAFDQAHSEVKYIGDEPIDPDALELTNIYQEDP